jgi:hypothetical protein
MRTEIDTLGANGSRCYRISEHRFENYTVLVVKSEWTKTQHTFCIRVLDFYKDSAKPHLQIPCDKLKYCKAFIEEAKNTGVLSLWTGHTANVGQLIETR